MPLVSVVLLSASVQAEQRPPRAFSLEAARIHAGYAAHIHGEQIRCVPLAQ
jgi:hypothetical protein